LPCLPEKRVFALREKVTWIEGGVDDFLGAVVVGSLFDEEDFEIRVGFSEAASDYTAC
jgi:hypothetical protein